ncbi:MAG: hypothetical protein SGILL_002175, partial [Bacillariaceae sp.]
GVLPPQHVPFITVRYHHHHLSTTTCTQSYYFMMMLHNSHFWKVAITSALVLSSTAAASKTTSVLDAATATSCAQIGAEEDTNVPPLPSTSKRLTEDTMSPFLRQMEYAVRGTVVIAADKINEELKAAATNDQKFPFDKIVYTNIGNPQSVGQKPLTWPRQVLALVDLPNEVGIDHPDADKLFPADAIRRARDIKERALSGHGSGAYTHSKGAKMFREDVCSFLQKRDGKEVPADPENIFLSNGASAAISESRYPIYSATLDLLGGQKVGYFLDEEHKWSLDMNEMERAYQQAIDEGTNVVGLVLINPGNPTGSVLNKEMVQAVVKFCSRHNLVLLADEVYQENVYDDTDFYSSKRAAYDTGLLQQDKIELASFHSTSKGVFGECGRRGGYMELCGFDGKIKEQLYKLASSSLCSTVSGQVMTSIMARGPDPGEESYNSHEAEKAAIFDSLKRRAQIVGNGLNSIPGFSCQPAQGAMYCFPSVQLPLGAVAAASEKGMSPDTLYAVSLLEHTGKL